jgi:hypothetical protein
VREPELRLDVLAQTESVFALSNGHIGLRGNLDEGEPHVIPGTYLNSYYESRPLPYAEAGYGYPEDGRRRRRHQRQAAAAARRRRALRRPLRRAAAARAHARPAAGTLSRRADWISPAGKRVRVRSTRLVSFAQRSVAAICYEVEAVDEHVRVIVQSELVANEEQPTLTGDPRVAAALHKPLGRRRPRRRAARRPAHARHPQQRPADGRGHGPTSSPPRAACRRRPTPATTGPARRSSAVSARRAAAGREVPGLRLVERPLVARGARPGGAALTSARYSGWEGLLAEPAGLPRRLLGRRRRRGRRRRGAQQAVRFGLFHVLQAGARAERRAIPAKGLTGPGYDGHAFWDTEGFVLAALTATAPDAAVDVLRWRLSTLDLARERAEQLGLRARRSRGGRSGGRSARRTGPPAPPRSTSTPSSPSPRSATGS